ncbi:MAG: hypothetical protein WC878_04670 [Candidatus Paceibacterota bacterium]
MTKKNVLLISSNLIVILCFLAYIQTGDICYMKSWCRNFWEEINLLGAILFIFIPIFLFSLITYKMRDEVFRSWIHFSCWWIPLSTIVSLITPESSSSLFSLDGKKIAVASSFLFALISLILIIYKSVKLRGK